LQRVLSTVTLLGLLVATAAAFAITEHLKLEKSPISVTGISGLFSPVCDCLTKSAAVGIRLRHTGHVTVTIVSSDGHEVATIAPNVLMQAHEERSFPWNGRTDAGALVPDGVYYPWVQLQRRTYRFINKIRVDTVPPRVTSAVRVKRSPTFFAGRGRSVAIRYTFSEKAHAVVYFRGRQIILGRKTATTSKIKWSGRVDQRSLPAGRYVLAVGAVDLAGNETPARERKAVTVVLRYAEITPARTTVRAGRRFNVHVQTAARRYTWRLGHRHGGRRGQTLRLRAPTTPGTYRLVVKAEGHATTAVVRVRPK
jgi:flagellar hook assembly protein FlgD